MNIVIDPILKDLLIHLCCSVPILLSIIIPVGLTLKKIVDNVTPEI